ncbi:MAG: tetratricopeptide repeat protein, partial [Flavobacteriaceae bacterium]
MNKYLLLLFLLVLINSYSQNKLNNNLKPINNKVNKCKQEIDSLAELAYKTSVSYFRKNDFNNAIKYSLIEINARKQLPNRTRYKKALFNQGLFLYRNKQYYKAINYYNIVIDSFSFDKKTLITYNQLGNVYKKLGDYYQSENFYKKSLLNPELLSIKELFGNYINTAILYDYIETKEDLKK